MAANKFLLQRIHTIDACLNNKLKRWTKEKLIERINEVLEEKGRFDKRVKRKTGISEKTFYNDIKYLREEKDAPIVCIDRIYKYESDFSLHKIDLNYSEIFKLQNALSILKSLDVMPKQANIQALVEKLELIYANYKSPKKPIVQFEHHTELFGLNKYFDTIYNAILNKNVIEVEYKRFNKPEAKKHIVEPYLLKEYKNFWYLFANLQKTNEIITLAIDRIKNITILKETYSKQKNFDADKYFNQAVGISINDKMKPENIKLKVLKHIADYILHQPIHSSQKTIKTFDNGDVLISLNVIINQELKNSLLLYIDLIQILEPLSLKKEMQVVLQNAIELNK